MNRYIFYHYNDVGTLIIDYIDDEIRISQAFIFYSFKQAIRKFRLDNDLQYKKIKISKLF